MSAPANLDELAAMFERHKRKERRLQKDFAALGVAGSAYRAGERADIWRDAAAAVRALKERMDADGR